MKKGRKRCIASAGETSAVQTRSVLTLSHQPLLCFIATCKQQEGGLQSCCNTQVGPFKRLKSPALNTESIRGSAYPRSLWSHAAGRCGEPQPHMQHRKDADVEDPVKRAHAENLRKDFRAGRTWSRLMFVLTAHLELTLPLEQNALLQPVLLQSKQHLEKPLWTLSLDSQVHQIQWEKSHINEIKDVKCSASLVIFSCDQMPVRKPPKTALSQKYWL